MGWLVRVYPTNDPDMWKVVKDNHPASAARMPAAAVPAYVEGLGVPLSQMVHWRPRTGP